jgi:hypothetical protein
MNFKEAYQKMLEGKKVKRKGWEGWQYYKLIGDNMYYANKLIASNITVENALADDWEIVGETKSKVWKPKKGDKYFFISSRLEVVKFNNQEDSVDKKVINSGNYFKTKEEAQHMVEKLKVIKELQDFAIENRDEEISWEEDSRYKFSIYFDYKWKMIRISWATVAHDSPFNIYFASEKAIHDAIDSIGEDRIKKYYFDVKD